MKLGQTIVEIRKEHNLTQEDFAKEFSVTRQTVSNWENEKSYPDLLTLIKISDTYNYSLDRMLKEDVAMTETMNRSIQLGDKYEKSTKRNLWISALGMVCCLVLIILSVVEDKGVAMVIVWSLALVVNVSEMISCYLAVKKPAKQERTLSGDDIDMVKQLLDRNMPAEAVKLVRKVTGLGLMDAKAVVDDIQKESL